MTCRASLNVCREFLGEEHVKDDDMNVHAHAGTATYPANTSGATYHPSTHTAHSQKAAPYLISCLRPRKRLAFGRVLRQFGWMATQGITRGRSRVDLRSPCCFLLVSIRTDPCRILRLGPRRYRAHGDMLVGWHVFHLFCRHLAATPKRHRYCACSLAGTQLGHVKGAHGTSSDKGI
jgi:hypothetical protein